jgi:hypothetical protein
MQHWHPAVQRDANDSTVYKRYIIDGSGDSIAYPQPSVSPNPLPMVAPGIKKRLFNQIARIKASPNYTEVIGHGLGIIAKANAVEHIIPESTVTLELGATGNRVRIDFKKYGHDSIWIESRINGGDWAFLAIDTIKPYYDERPLAPGNTHETREYRLRWWDKSIAHGEWSAVQQVVLGA